MRCTTCSLASALTVVLLVMAIPSAARRPVAGLIISNFADDISEAFEVAASPRTLVEAVLGPPDSCQNFKVPALTASTCGAYIETDIRPLRKEWERNNSFCGEMSLQLTAMTRGIYLSQQIAREIGVRPGSKYPDLLFDERHSLTSNISGVYGVATMLGLHQPPESYWYIDNQTLSATKQLTPGPETFALWIKQNILAGRPVIIGVWVKGGSWPEYHHIVPMFGICHHTSTFLANTDVFVMTDNDGAEWCHTPADKDFYTDAHSCSYPRYAGCIPTDYNNHGVVIGPLKAPAGMYYPVKLVITGWSDGSDVSGEPGEHGPTTATASYSLTVSGLTPGNTYMLYRTTGLFEGYQVPQSPNPLSSICTAQGPSKCSTISFTATGPVMSFTQGSTGDAPGAPSLGEFAATSVTYFLVVQA